MNADDEAVLGNSKDNPISANLYAYCNNNPVMHSDPSGNWVLDAIFLAVDVAEMIRHPSVGNACWVLLDCACFADATGVLAAGGHALKVAHAAEETVHAVDEANHAAKLSKAAIRAARARAVRQAWKAETKMVRSTGRGTRGWSKAEKIELLTRGKVKGYVGHHINSVKGHEHLAGNPDNIRFLTRKEHLAAHRGNWRNSTHGRLLHRYW